MRDTVSARAFRSWHSLDRRLPLLISVLLLLAVTAIAVGAYQSVRGVLMETAADRTEDSAQQLAALLQRSAQQRRAELARLAAEPALARWLAVPADPTAAADAERVLATLSAEPQTIAAELRGTGGRRLVSFATDASPAERAVAGARADPAPGIGPLLREGELLYYEVSTPLPVAAGTPTAGWLTSRRRVATGPTASAGARAVSSLMGPQMSLLVGNASGGVWTDFSRVLEPPIPISNLQPGRAELFDSNRRIGVAVPIGGTPWMAWVEAPLSTGLAPLRPFSRQLVWIVLAVVVAGALAARLVGRRITGPINRLTIAAEGLAAGQPALAVPTHRHDEIGRLAAAFASMRDQLLAAQRDLEGRVDERTAELRRALASLEQAQADLLRNERLAMLGQLASSVGHELRNPLAVMTNAVFYLEMVLADPPEDVRDYLDIIRHEIGLSEKIVTDLLDFARVKTPQRSAVDLAAMAEEQLHRLGALPGIRVERNFAHALPRAWADPVQAGQVTLNLVANAVQAMGEGGGTLVLEGRSNGDQKVELVVRDDGPGVPPELRDKVFEPLFTTKARGIGLGLAVSRRLAESNDGELLLLDSGPAGAAFALRLPVAGGGVT
jgi:signal transduction histidine kinase